ncbi:hypothetical protein MKW94_014008, partial [Papaver nudicaule]|nr:hypothetical protein [Papaver nudicaule]
MGSKVRLRFLVLHKLVCQLSSKAVFLAFHYLWAKLMAHPSTRMYLQQPDFVQMIQNIQKNPDMVNMYMNDQRMMAVLGLNINMRTANPDEMEGDLGGMKAAESESKILPEKKQPPPPKQKEPEPMDIPDEEKEKELGTAAYKKKDFETAIEHYTRALELNDEDISFITNRAANEECIKDCDRAVERGRKLRSDYKMIARALTRKGTAFVKMAKTSQDYAPAIEAFQKALTEHRNPDTLKKLNEAEKAKKDLEQQEYFDPKLADEEREKGNDSFKQQKYPEAVSHYSLNHFMGSAKVPRGFTILFSTRKRALVEEFPKGKDYPKKGEGKGSLKPGFKNQVKGPAAPKIMKVICALSINSRNQKNGFFFCVCLFGLRYDERTLFKQIIKDAVNRYIQ